MVFKVLLAGLVEISFCMANISGIVTNIGATPISGVVVQLEKGGQIATTEADGCFTLIVGSTNIFPDNDKSRPSGLITHLSGNLIVMTIAKQSDVEFTIFNLAGKALSKLCMTLDAGSHSISLPNLGYGIYLYKVKTGNSEHKIKSNTINSVSTCRELSSQGTCLDVLAKVVNDWSAIDDVIKATKDGYLNYRCVQYSSDTTGIKIKMIANAGNVTDADGNVYQSVRIGNQVWTVENLRTTKYNDGSPISHDTDRTGWISHHFTHTGVYCYYFNTTNIDTIKKFGALYNWYAVKTGMLTPVGWHVPTYAEWDILQNYMISNGYNYDGTTMDNKIAKSMATRTDWEPSTEKGVIGNDLAKNNSCGFSALPAGYYYGGGDVVDYHNGYLCRWWSSTEDEASLVSYYELYYFENCLLNSISEKNSGFSVRLLQN